MRDRFYAAILMWLIAEIFVMDLKHLVAEFGLIGISLCIKQAGVVAGGQIESGSEEVQL